MAKITSDNISSGYASTSALDANFDRIDTEFNDKVLYRNNPTGEANQMENDIDINGYRIINHPAPTDGTHLVRQEDLGLSVFTDTTLPSQASDHGVEYPL
jgi:hypothetical protein